jgi:outer membrane lipoprotein SlyB
VRLLTLVAIGALGLAGCGGSGSGEDSGSTPESEQTRLTISYRATPNSEPAIARVVCNGNSGDEACRAVARIPADTWQPVPPDRACTQVYGGPQTARVAGTVAGRGIDADFSRVNGCEIGRWDQIAALLEATGLTGAG